MMKTTIISTNNKLPFEDLSNLIETNLSGFDGIPIFDILKKSHLATHLYKNSF